MLLSGSLGMLTVLSDHFLVFFGCCSFGLPCRLLFLLFGLKWFPSPKDAGTSPLQAVAVVEATTLHKLFY